MRITAAGDRGLFVAIPGATAERLRAVADRTRAIAGVVAAIVGHESVYVIGTSDRAALERAAEDASEAVRSAATVHDVEVSFAPEHALDLDDLLARANLPRGEMIARVADVSLTVRYLGFHSGFGYLEGWPESWSLPRRPTSRNRVPGGSFATAATMAGIYPVDSPGGWNVLGRTDAVPKLRPGDRVRIVPVERPLMIKPPLPRTQKLLIDVIAPGQMTTVVHPREWAKLEEGEIAGGPFDEEAAAVANGAAGNDGDVPLFECVLVGPRLRARHATRIAWCGAALEPRVWNVQQGEEVDIGRIRDGFRGYVAITGGVVEVASRRQAQRGRGGRTRGEGSPWEIRILRGPHDAPPLPENWEVTPQINRVGIRLRPIDVSFTPAAELPSCGMQFGTLQWHPDGSVVAMGPDHPVTGGYLQPATVLSSELWKLGQLAPGESVRLVE